jgi:hypothetical protein
MTMIDVTSLLTSKEQWIALLKSDVKAFNAAHQVFRANNPDTPLDLSDANLRGANLSGADLCFTNLYSAKLSDTNLSYADLRFANLQRSDLIDVNLSGAKMIGTNLCSAKIRSTDMSGADLTKAIFFSKRAVSFARRNGAIVSDEPFIWPELTEHQNAELDTMKKAVLAEKAAIVTQAADISTLVQTPVAPMPSPTTEKPSEEIAPNLSADSALQSLVQQPRRWGLDKAPPRTMILTGERKITSMFAHRDATAAIMGKHVRDL